MNYRDELLNYIKEGKVEQVKVFQEEEHPIEALEKAYELTYNILNTRFDNELKQYNNNEKKAYDEFVARKNLDYLRIYIEEFLLLDKEESEYDFYKAVRKHMRDLLNNFHAEVLN